MKAYPNITQKEVDELLAKFKLIFPYSRVLKAREVNGLLPIGETGNSRCYNVWNKEIPCDKCTSLKTLRDHKPRVKLEYMGSQPYQVFSRYLCIDGEDSVLELVVDVDALNLTTEDVRVLANKFLDMDEELYKDTLTGTLNRAYYDNRKLEVLENSAVVVLDLDNLKDLNDSFGHNFGDVAIKAIADELVKNVRSDDFVIRYGGDEFILILPNITKESLLPKLNRIRKEVFKIVLPEHDKVQLSISVGAVMAKKETLQNACKRADKYMYKAKSRKNCVVTEWSDDTTDIKELNTDADKLYLLIVDDSDINRFLLKSMLEDKYKILEAKDGREAIEVIEDYRQNISLILLDIEMPNMGGFEYLNYLRNNNYLSDIPVIMISSDNNEDVILRSYELGAIDFITRPYNAKIVLQRVENISKLFLKQRKFKTAIRRQMDKSEEEAKMLSIIYSYAIEYRNGESATHIVHVERLTEILLNELPRMSEYTFTDADKKNIITASGMHDIGKIGVPAEILNNHNRNAMQEADYEMHTLIGAEILESMRYYKDQPLIQTAHNVCRWHHERYDGTGFPDKIKGDQIPIEAQIVSIANAFDSYLSKYDFDLDKVDDVVKQIEEGKDGKFNPMLVACLIKCKELFKEVYKEDSTTSGGYFTRP